MCLLSAHILFLVFRYGLNFFGCWILLLQTIGTRTVLEDIVMRPYRNCFFKSRMSWNFDRKNVFFLWKFWNFWPFSKKYNYRLKCSKVFVGMIYDIYESTLSLHIEFETLTRLQYIRHKIFSKQKKRPFFRKFTLRKILCLLYFNHVSVSKTI